MTGAQLTLGVRLRDDARWSNFHGQRNEAPAALLRTACEGGLYPVIVVCGDEDTGKSHLLQAACHDAERDARSAICMSMAELLPMGPGVLDSMDEIALVALDDVQLVAGLSEWEEALFHLYNRVQDRNHQLIVSLTELPANIVFVLPDLRSRLQHGLLVQLGVYRDEDRVTILQARAEQRGLMLSDEVAGFIMRRASRRLMDLLGILDTLDENSLQAQRRLTIPFVKSVMGW